MKLTGHKTESIYRRYAIVNEGDLAQGVAKLASLHEEPALGGPRDRPSPGEVGKLSASPVDNSGRRGMRGPWNSLKDWCRGRESNPHTSRDVADFKSAAYVQFRHPGARWNEGL